MALFHLDRHEDCVRLLSRIPNRNARQEMRMAASYALLGERELARRHVERARILAPGQDFVELARIGYSFEHDRHRQAVVDGVRLALEMGSGS
jgi:hypothetical protein